MWMTFPRLRGRSDYKSHPLTGTCCWSCNSIASSKRFHRDNKLRAHSRRSTACTCSPLVIDYHFAPKLHNNVVHNLTCNDFIVRFDCVFRLESGALWCARGRRKPTTMRIFIAFCDSINQCASANKSSDGEDKSAFNALWSCYWIRDDAMHHHYRARRATFSILKMKKFKSNPLTEFHFVSFFPLFER